MIYSVLYVWFRYNTKFYPSLSVTIVSIWQLSLNTIVYMLTLQENMMPWQYLMARRELANVAPSW